MRPIKAQRDPKTLVIAPITRCVAGVTPGFHVLEVVDLNTERIVDNVTRADCDNGLVWAKLLVTGRSYMIPGRFVLMCSKEDLKVWEEVWKSLP